MSSSDSDISYRAGAYVFAGVAAGLVFGFLLSQPIFFWKSNTVGNVAEVLNVVVAIFVGASVFALSRKTNRLAELSNETNRGMHQIESNRIARESELHAAEGNVVLMAIGPELAQLRASALSLKEILSREFNSSRDSEVCWNVTVHLLEQLPVGWYQPHSARLLVLGPSLARRLAYVYGMVAQIKVLARNCADSDIQNRNAAFDAIQNGLSNVAKNSETVVNAYVQVLNLMDK